MPEPFDKDPSFDPDAEPSSTQDDEIVPTEAIRNLVSAAGVSDPPTPEADVTSSRTIIMPKSIPAYLSGPAADLKHFLVITRGAEQGQRYELDDKPLILGRRDVGIKISDPAVSGRHCRITKAGNKLMVEDLLSSNGTYVAGKKIRGLVSLSIGDSLRVGATEFRFEVRSEQELKQGADQDHQIERAAAYVQSILPPPLNSDEVSIRCRFLPSSKLGGDAFSYQWLDDDHLAIYLIDVCGHGLDSALHSVSVVQLLRTGSLAGVDFRQPGEVLEELNRAFHMEDHGGMYFTAWYGVYHRRERCLRFASAGHPPALMLTEGSSRKVWTHQPPIGMLKGERFFSEELHLADRARLFVFSDGAFELTMDDGEEWTLDGLFEVLGQAGKLAPEAELDSIEKTLRKIQDRDQFADDLSILLADFH